jgi:hypothetical protein
MVISGVIGGMASPDAIPGDRHSWVETYRRRQRKDSMTDKINGKEVGQRSAKRSRGKRQGTHTWQIEDAARFLFKAQCYDAGPDSETRCGLCCQRIRLCYVLKVLETADPLSPEVGKLTIGECCFRSIEVINGKLYRRLLAAAINLRTFMEAIERDKEVCTGSAKEKVAFSQSLPVGSEATLSDLFESLATQGGTHV